MKCTFLALVCAAMILPAAAQRNPGSQPPPPQLGPKAKMIVNPMGKHSSDLNDPNLCSPDIKQEVMDHETLVCKNFSTKIQILLPYFFKVGQDR